jgi:prolycopene isomerase
LLNPDPHYFSRIRSWTFQQLLDQYFDDQKLKAILSFPLFGNAGLPPSRLSAFLGAKIYKEFLLDGGYYPEGGMQVLADAFAQRFRELGGELRLKRLVKKIDVQDRRVTGVILEQDGFIPANCVVSNGDARLTFCELLGNNVVGQDFVDFLKSMSHSLSMFILYLGLNGYDDHLPAPGTNLWILHHYDLDDAYASAQEGAFDRIGGYMMRIAPDIKSMVAFINAPFKSKEYWKENKDRMTKFFISKIKREAIPDLSNYIAYEESATPYTLYRYTLNYQGAAYGWEGTPSQLAVPELRKPSSIQGLYLAGHWTTHGLGIPGVVYVGYDTSRSILRKIKTLVL